MTEAQSPPAYVYTQQPQVVVQQPVLDNPPGDQFIMSLFTTFCCFMPFGIIALIKSMEVCFFWSEFISAAIYPNTSLT